MKLLFLLLGTSDIIQIDFNKKKKKKERKFICKKKIYLDVFRNDYIITS